MSSSLQRISDARLDAKPFYQVEYITVDNHSSANVTTSATWLAKPLDHMGRYFATCIKLQAIGGNIRYKVDEQLATSDEGFQLVSGSETLIPVSNKGISIAAESGTVNIQYQWVR